MNVDVGSVTKVKVSKSVSVSVSFKNYNNILKRIIDNQRAKLFLAETCARYFNPYVPMQTGTLSQTYETEPGKIIYDQPYADRIYNGHEFNFSKEKHPQASAEWDKPAMSAHRNQIAKEVQAFIRKE